MRGKFVWRLFKPGVAPNETRSPCDSNSGLSTGRVALVDTVNLQGEGSPVLANTRM